nr:glycosyltransferase family A protein [Effusibacillus dendaii]
MQETLQYIAQQDYKNGINIVLVDNGSSDNTIEIAEQAAKRWGLSLRCLEEQQAGKHLPSTKDCNLSKRNC